MQNKTKLEALKKKYPHQFSLVESPNTWMVSPSLKKVTNHTKYFGVDWGKYYILGGSAIKDNFNQTGLDNPLEEVIGKELCTQLFENLSEIETFVHGAYQSMLGNDLGNDEIELVDLKQYSTQANNLKLLIGQMEEKLRAFPETKNREFDTAIHRLNLMISMLKKFEHSLEALDRNNRRNFIDHVKTLQELMSAFHTESKAPSKSPDPEQSPYLQSLFGFAQQASLFKQAIMGHINSGSGGVTDSGLVGLMVPGNFRDMDFVFHNPEGENSPGRKLFLQMLTLAYRWEQFNAAVNKDESVPVYSPQEVPKFGCFIHSESSEEIADVKEKDTPTIRLMKLRMKDPKEVITSVPAFDNHAAAEKKGKMKVLFSGPEQPNETSDFRREALIQIQNAREEIVINHMYFHPTQDIQDALVQAAE
ncbi:MAG: hypothetical protein KDK71_10540, partial [Chlamydiia bacterium]|nr:hypothetical protein [Chlamydiia bacterium]